MTIWQSMGRVQKARARRNPRWEECPNAPGVLCEMWGAAPFDHENTARPMRLNLIPDAAQPHERQPAVISRRDDQGYDEIDRRRLDTFPASDAVARY